MLLVGEIGINEAVIGVEIQEVFQIKEDRCRDIKVIITEQIETITIKPQIAKLYDVLIVMVKTI